VCTEAIGLGDEVERPRGGVIGRAHEGWPFEARAARARAATGFPVRCAKR
jgi:pantoate kinase